MAESSTTQRTPLRWILFAVIIALCGYALWTTGGVTRQVSVGQQAHPAGLRRLGSGALCQLPAELASATRLDLRLSEDRDGVVVSRRFTVGAGEGTFRLPVTEGAGEGMITGTAIWTFTYGPAGCADFAPLSFDAEPAAEAP